eukprot:Blabericola_migrator_1__302@NODE_1079_length_5509_cov_250_056781_g739_i0_p3_GENE_NODE_1079_length_5509_cov_250_056781_g739_i0NODE_1079_length_5509_cov_250_056781_g739_i0_p3_ORF_typecomplete_len121_score19_44G0G1_switch_2/PF15103_6/0_00066DsbD_2/PF13386_6/0_003LapA_dom/PF06305_11/0_0066SfLAP/PF11139_8/0_0048DUF5129/PF17173_4/0_0056Herpes_gE/PF02480_16/0_0062HemY_N/PF07219_13/0_011TMEM132D_C/PF15706_5/0_013CbtA/PF09490_10/0_02TMEM154/PF15102_6/0_028DUF5134/PF17197_4/0_027PAP_PilO/PF06864_12/0_03T2
MGNGASVIAQYNQQRLTTMAYVLGGVLGVVVLGFLVAFVVSAVSRARSDEAEAKARAEAQREHTAHQADILMLEMLNQNRQVSPPAPIEPSPIIQPVQPIIQPVILSPPPVGHQTQYYTQ